MFCLCCTALHLGKHSRCPRVPVVPARGTPPDPCPTTPWHSARAPPLPSRGPARPPPLLPVPALMNPALAVPWGGVHPPNSATQTIMQLLFQFFPGVRNSGWGVQAIPPDANFFDKKTDLGAGMSKLGGYPAQGPPFTSEPR